MALTDVFSSRSFIDLFYTADSRCRSSFLIWALMLSGQLIFAELGHSQPVGEQPVVTTVCDLVTQPQHFDGRIVRIQARYESDGMEQSTLMDSKCPNVGVAPSGHFRDLKVGGAFFAALQKGCAGTFDKQVTATWTGTYHWQPENKPGSGRLLRWLDVQKIDDLEVTPRAGVPSCR